MDLGYGSIKSSTSVAGAGAHFQRSGQFTNYLNEAVKLVAPEELARFASLLEQYPVSHSSIEQIQKTMFLQGAPSEWEVWLKLYIRPTIYLEMFFPAND